MQKTHTIKTPKAELMVVELPRVCNYELTKEGLFVKKHGSHLSDYIEGSYTLLGNPDEIREEDARKLVDRIGEGDPCYQGDWFVNYQDDEYMFETAKESLLSLIDSEIYWDVNPLGEKYDVELIAIHKSEIAGKHLIELWNKAEQKTFDRNRSLIFKKN